LWVDSKVVWKAVWMAERMVGLKVAMMAEMGLKMVE
jgi:hypothetical protein